MVFPGFPIFLHHVQLACHHFNPSNAETSFLHLIIRMQRFLKNILTLSCWYSLESSCWVLRWVPICQGFSYFSRLWHNFVLAKLATSSIRVKPDEDWTGDDYRNFKILITKIIRLILRCCLDDWVNKPGIQLQSKMNLPWWILRPTIDFFVAPTDSGNKWIQKTTDFPLWTNRN